MTSSVPPDAAPAAPSKTPPATVGMPGWDRWLQNLVLLFGRLALAYVFFAGIWWKLPADFGCSDTFAFPVVRADGTLDSSKSSGLCYYLGLEMFYAPTERKVLIADLQYAGGQQIAFNISPIAQLNAQFVSGFVQPNIRWFGYIIVGSEILIAVSMFLGLFTRLGGLVAIGIATQLYVGLANIPRPYEWEWSYGLMVALAVVMFGLAPGRFLGIDGLLRRWLSPAGARGNLLAKLVLLLT